MFQGRTFALLSLLLPVTAVGLAAPSTALAAIPAATSPLTPPNTNTPADTSADAPPNPPGAQADTLSGSLQLVPSVAWVGVWGDLSNASPVSRSLGGGPGFGLDVAYGISRSVQVGAWGRLDEYAGSETCSGCSGQSFGLGPSVSYRLTQGTRFDPWASIGVGYSFATVQASSSESSYSGPEWARLGLGGDWYLSPSWYLGLFTELSLGTHQKVPAAERVGSPHYRLAAGLRLGLSTTPRN